jgi:hypothetical protein
LLNPREHGWSGMNLETKITLIGLFLIFGGILLYQVWISGRDQ